MTSGYSWGLNASSPAAPLKLMPANPPNCCNKPDIPPAFEPMRLEDTSPVLRARRPYRAMAENGSPKWKPVYSEYLKTNETGDFRKSDLVELTRLDPTIKLEIRYATTNNFLGTVFYSEPRAFMQRPAAEALVRAHQKLKAQGYGLLIHDAYRPWYVTKVFWDATPDDKKIFVANPSQGSRHNRGCAVDLSLYDLKTGKPVEMVSTYDETTDRAYPNYPGGTSLQRWHRELLRQAMESEGFTAMVTKMKPSWSR